MPEPEKNPHVDLNNAREEARQEKRCTRRCPPGLAHPECELHGFRLGSTTRPVWDGPPPPPKTLPKVPLSAVTGILERLTENHATLLKLCKAYTDSLDPGDYAWKNPALVAIADFLDRKHRLPQLLDRK